MLHELDLDWLQRAHALRSDQGDRYVGRDYWYARENIGVTSDYYGLLDTNGNRKASFTAYEHYATY